MTLSDDPPREWRCPRCGYPNTGRYCRDCGYDNSGFVEMISEVVYDDLMEKLADRLRQKLK